jgi:hypothetical protein
MVDTYYIDHRNSFGANKNEDLNALWNLWNKNTSNLTASEKIGMQDLTAEISRRLSASPVTAALNPFPNFISPAVSPLTAKVATVLPVATPIINAIAIPFAAPIINTQPILGDARPESPDNKDLYFVGAGIILLAFLFYQK